MATNENEKTNEISFNNAGRSFDQILETARVKTTAETNASVATPAEVDAIIKSILTAKKLPVTQENYNRVLATCAHFVQIGATSPKFATTRVILDYGIELKAGELREACNKNNTTTRKFARGIRDFVIKVATAFNLEGNLSKNYKLENPTCDKQDLVWVSDFQTFTDNPAMPDHVRTWLLENYRSRFRPNEK